MHRGTVLGKEEYPFQLHLQSLGSRQLVRCAVSIGRLGHADEFPQNELFEKAAIEGICLAIRDSDEKRTYDVTIEGDIVLAERSASDAARIVALLRRVLGQSELLKPPDGARSPGNSLGNALPLQVEPYPESFDWSTACRAKDFSINCPYVDVSLPGGRRQSIFVEYDGGAYRLSTFIAKQAVVSALSDLPLQTWSRNNFAQLVGFRMDCKRRLVGEAWIPNIGLTPEDICFYLRVVAQAADRFEYALTGKDAE
jgi:hypothetical protein